MTSRTTIQHIITSLPLDIATAELASVIDTLTYEVAAHRLQSNTGSEASGPHPQSGLSVDKPDAPDNDPLFGRLYVEGAYQVAQEIKI